MPHRISLLGIPIDALSKSEAVRRIIDFSHDQGQQHHIMTPNPEMLVHASNDPQFADLLQRTSMNVPDGVGLLLAARLFGKRLPERVTGTDLLDALCAEQDVGDIFFLGAAPGVAEKASTVLQKQYPHLRIVGCFAGSPDRNEEDAIIHRINASGASILFVAYGAPAQDVWIDRNLSKMPNVRVAMGVGGAFDFIAGVQQRAPTVMRSIGLEWLWRLLHEPWRLKRITKAVIVFPLLTLRSALHAMLRS